MLVFVSLLLIFFPDSGKEVFFVLSVSEALGCEIGVKLLVGTEFIFIFFL